MIIVTMEQYEDLSEKERENASSNGSGKEFAHYIRIKHNNETIILKSDAMEREDAVFFRDLRWIVPALKKCYEIGLSEGK